MNIEITGVNVEITTALKELAEKKLTKLKTFDANIQRIHIVFKLDNHEHHASSRVHTKGENLIANASSKDMYKTIDLLVDKLVHQIKNKK